MEVFGPAQPLRSRGEMAGQHDEAMSSFQDRGDVVYQLAGVGPGVMGVIDDKCAGLPGQGAHEGVHGPEMRRHRRRRRRPPP